MFISWQIHQSIMRVWLLLCLLLMTWWHGIHPVLTVPVSQQRIETSFMLNVLPVQVSPFSSFQDQVLQVHFPSLVHAKVQSVRKDANQQVLQRNVKWAGPAPSSQWPTARHGWCHGPCSAEGSGTVGPSRHGTLQADCGPPKGLKWLISCKLSILPTPTTVKQSHQRYFVFF